MASWSIPNLLAERIQEYINLQFAELPAYEKFFVHHLMYLVIHKQNMAFIHVVMHNWGQNLQ